MQPEIRPLAETEVETIIAAGAGESSWQRNPAYWQGRLQEQATGLTQGAIASIDGRIAGYGFLIWVSAYAPFVDAEIPEINDLRVAQHSRRRGVATAMIAAFEGAAIAAGRHAIGLGVGLYVDYGPAQALYSRLGYVPDCRGVTFGSDHHVAPPGALVSLDDDLLLWLVKDLRREGRTLA